MKRIILFMVCLLFMIVGCGEAKDTFGDTKINEVSQRWDIEFPINGVLEYQRTTATFSGDGSRYFIYQYSDNSIEDLIEFEKEKNQDIENKMGHIQDEGWDNQKPVCPVPTFEDKYEWKMIDKEYDDLYLLYFPNQYRLYVLDIHV